MEFAGTPITSITAIDTRRATDAEIIRTLKSDRLLYFDSISRTPGSKQHVLGAIREQGKDTVVRLCLAPVGDEMPLRALGYVASLLRLYEAYLPRAEAQIITPVHTLQRVNNNSSAEAAAVDLCKDLGIFNAMSQRLSKPPQLMTDIPVKPTVSEVSIQAAMQGTKEEARLMQQASKRGDPCSYSAYVAGHMAIYNAIDTVLPLLNTGTAAPMTEARRIIVVGAQSERVFDNSLALCRQAGVHIQNACEETGMLFTKFVRPPYLKTLPDESGEIPYFDPLIPDYLAIRDPILNDLEAVRADSVKRDLVFTRDTILRMLGFKKPDSDVQP